MKAFEQAWTLLKRRSVRGMRGPDNILHYPMDLDYTSMSNYMMGLEDPMMSDLVAPYLQGQFTIDTGINEPMDTQPPSYQMESSNQMQEVQPAPFPKTAEEIQNVTDMMGGLENYEPKDQTVGQNRRRAYDTLHNTIRVLGRGLRENEAFDFKPQRVSASGRTGAGRRREGQNQKLMSYLKTPISPVLATTSRDIGSGAVSPSKPVAVTV
jgi:hypothetical protein